jgi:hypothetical protein
MPRKGDRGQDKKKINIRTEQAGEDSDKDHILTLNRNKSKEQSLLLDHQINPSKKDHLHHSQIHVKGPNPYHLLHPYLNLIIIASITVTVRKLLQTLINITDKTHLTDPRL